VWPKAVASLLMMASMLAWAPGVGAVVAPTLAAQVVPPPPRVCPCSIWNDSTIPANPAANDPAAVELGVKFQSDTDGFINAIRFYKGPGTTGTHTGSLWSNTGSLLATATFIETPGGWQQVSLATPVAITAGTTYVASYHAPNGNYAADGGYFNVPRDNPPLHAPDSVSSGGNGVFVYGAGGFPTRTFNATNYWVDVVFARPAPTITVATTAAPASLPEPGGAFTFNVTVTNTTVRPVTITSLTDSIYGNIATQGTCTTAVGTALAASGGSFSCTFTGNFNGLAPASQTDTVTAGAVDADGITATATGAATVTLTPTLPTITVGNNATPASLPEPGGSFTFNVAVTNTSLRPVTITTLTDSVYGNLASLGSCVSAIGTVLTASGGSYSCSFPGSFTGNAGASQSDTVTATAVDNLGSPATASASASVSLSDVPPSVTVVETVTPSSLPEPGGVFSFGVVVTNTSFESVTITALTDSVYGNVATQGSCSSAVGSVLAPGGSYTCAFPGTFTGLAPASQADTVTAAVVDNDGTAATATGGSTLNLTPTAPTLTVGHTAMPASLPEPGGTFTFGVSLRNPGLRPATITSLTDNVYGNIATQGTCATAVGTVLGANGGTYTCSFTGGFSGNSGASQTDTVTAMAVDSFGSRVTGSRDAVVTLTDVPPTVVVAVTSTPASLPEPGGLFTFGVSVTNTSFEPVTITSLSDDVYGNIATQGTCTTAVGSVVAANGGTYTCSFTGNFTGNSGASQTDTVTGVVVDNDGTSGRATATASVILTKVTSQYVMVAKDGGVFAPGGQGFVGTAGVRPGEGILRDAQGRIIGASGSPLDSPVVAFSYTPTRKGYWLVQANGGVIPIGDAANLGDLKSIRLRSPVVGAAATADGSGLYLVASDGGIFALGNAPFKGSLGGLQLNKPIVGMGLDPDGSGYLLVASDGGVFAFDAAFRGSLGATPLNKPIVGMAVTADGGYVLAASDGGAFNYGTPFAGSLGNVKLVAPIVGIVADPDGGGYWMAGADGGAFAFDARFFGSVAPLLLNAPISGIAAL